MLFKKTTISEFVWQRNHNVCVHNLLNKNINQLYSNKDIIISNSPVCWI